MEFPNVYSPLIIYYAVLIICIIIIEQLVFDDDADRLFGGSKKVCDVDVDGDVM